MKESIFGRDYNTITIAEQAEWGRVKYEELIDKSRPDGIRLNKYSEYPKAVRHYLSLFPNNLLDSFELSEDRNELAKVIIEFQGLLNSSAVFGEREILSFIKQKKAYFLIGAILQKGFPFGHHACFIFPEFQLGAEYKVDYLLVGANSQGYHFVFVELEDCKGSVTINDGDFGLIIRKGLSQITRWRVWLNENFQSLRSIFEKSIGPEYPVLPKEFTVPDQTRLHFVVVAGKRSDYTEYSQRLQREEKGKSNTVLHYENLVENAFALLERNNY
jgi:Domain of unknown function (DUF4263)